MDNISKLEINMVDRNSAFARKTVTILCPSIELKSFEKRLYYSTGNKANITRDKRLYQKSYFSPILATFLPMCSQSEHLRTTFFISPSPCFFCSAHAHALFLRPYIFSEPRFFPPFYCTLKPYLYAEFYVRYNKSQQCCSTCQLYTYAELAELDAMPGCAYARSLSANLCTHTFKLEKTLELII